jgi:CheY-like chemotaxis protein
MKTPVLFNDLSNVSMAHFKSILVIDDDPISNMISTKMIEMSSDCPVISFTDPCAALEKLKEWHTPEANDFPKIIFLDINMPVLNGWEFLDEFQKLSGKHIDQCSVFMLSSSIDRKDIAKSKTYSTVQNFIPKPLTPDKLKTLPISNCKQADTVLKS